MTDASKALPPQHEPRQHSLPDGAPPLWQRPLFWLATGLALRVALLPINHAEYTDGYLQLEALTLRVGLYPPLYGLMSHGLAVTGLAPETAGKLVSAMASALAVLPIWWLVRQAGGGPRAGAWAAALYTASPLVLRWSVRLMTDSLFFALATGAMAFLCAALATRSREHSDDNGIGTLSPMACLASGGALAALATLTRWQGLALLPLTALAAAIAWRRSAIAPPAAVATFLPWLIVPVAAHYVGFAHGGQFSERTTGQTLSTLLAYWNMAESFVLLSPYIFGYPLVALAVVQVCRCGFGRWPFTVIALWTLYCGAFLAAQSAFGSFQHRYILPWLPVVIVPAALLLESLGRTRPGRAAWIGLATLAWLVAQSALVLVLQRGIFGDQREVAEWAGANPQLRGIPILSNERYGNFTEVGSLKQSRWSGREVRPLLSPADIPPGPFAIIASNAYGGDQAVASMLQAIQSTHRLRPLYSADRTVVALQDEVMTNPMFNQNPLGWVVRYVPQNFRTQLLLAEPRQ